jgi:hypothetical protein
VADIEASESEALYVNALRVIDIGECDAIARRRAGGTRDESSTCSSAKQMPASQTERRRVRSIAKDQRIASGATKVPVKPTAFGTVNERKNVARPVF